MCGIAGIIDLDHSKMKFSENVQRMMDTLKHRGPDDEFCYGMDFDTKTVCSQQKALHSGTWNVICGFRRLSIRDLSINGWQPMTDPAHQVMLTVNREIYNTQALLSDPALKGIKLRGSSDSEILLHMYLRYGIHGTLKRINGIYAGIIADSRTRTVICSETDSASSRFIILSGRGYYLWLLNQILIAKWIVHTGVR